MCWLDDACILGGGRVSQMPSPCGVGGETGYTGQEDLKFINSYNMGDGRTTIRVWFFCSCIPRPSLVLPAHLSLGHHKGYLTLPLQTSLSWHLDISVRSSLCFIEEHSEWFIKEKVVNVWNFTYHWNSVQGNGPGIYIFTRGVCWGGVSWALFLGSQVFMLL